MPHLWDADIDLSPEAAALLIERQFPALAPARLEAFGVGWDNTAYLVNGRFVFRFPRRRVAAGFIEREARVLPLLAPHLPLAVPLPSHIGVPADGYPYSFAGYPLIPGVTACRVPWTDEGRARLAEPLARFLRALHHLSVDDDTRAWAPGDEIARTDLARRAGIARERLLELSPNLLPVDLPPLLALLDRLAATPPHAGTTCWVHGDLYARHLLIDDALRPCGIIDWGDVHLGDPAHDFSLAFSFLPPAARDPFRAAYGPIDPAAWDRARFHALHYGAALVTYGAVVADAAIRGVGEYALRIAVT